MPRTAKVFMTNRSQAVRLPKEYHFSTDEGFIRKEGDDVTQAPRLACVLRVGAGRVRDVHGEVDELPVQEREA